MVTANNSQAFIEFFNELYKSNWRYLCNHLRSQFGDGPPEPEDMAQLAFARISTLECAEQLENPRAYLYRTAVNLTIDYQRKHQSQNRTLQLVGSIGVDDETAGDLEHQLGERQALKIVAKVILSQTERDRTFFLLNRLEGVSAAEIARRTNMSASGVKRVILKVMADCQRALHKAQQGSEV